MANNFKQNKHGNSVKTCSVCSETKLTTLFHKNANRSDGRDNRCKNCKRIVHKKNYDEKQALRRRKHDLKKKYGITSEGYAEMLDSQGGCCAICKISQINVSKRFAVDHSHIDGHVRGLLCTSCNTALGKFNDNIELLDTALSYLKNKGE